MAFDASLLEPVEQKNGFDPSLLEPVDKPSAPKADLSSLDLKKIAADDAAARNYTESMKDTGFTRATGGGLPGLFAKGIGAVSQDIIEPAAAGLLKAISPKAPDVGGGFIPKPAEEEIQPGKPLIHLPISNDKGILPAISRFAEGMTTPGSLLTLPFAAESKALQTGFAAQALSSVPESLQRLSEATTPDEQKDAATELGLTLGMAGLMTHGLSRKTPTKGETNARTIPSPESVSQPEVRPSVGEEAPLNAGTVAEPKTFSPVSALGKPTVGDIVKHRQILDSVVASVPIDVVNMLGGKERTLQMLLHDKPMLADALSANLNKDVFIRARDSFSKSIAAVRAKLSSSLEDRLANANSIAALDALNNDLVKIGGSPVSSHSYNIQQQRKESIQNASTIEPTTEMGVRGEGGEVGTRPPLRQQGETPGTQAPPVAADEARGKVSGEAPRQPSKPVAPLPINEAVDYSPADLERYKEMKAKSIPKTLEEFNQPEFQKNMAGFEALRNKYNGMPPKQLEKSPTENGKNVPETITGSNEEKASEIPAEAGASPATAQSSTETAKAVPASTELPNVSTIGGQARGSGQAVEPVKAGGGVETATREEKLRAQSLRELERIKQQKELEDSKNFKRTNPPQVAQPLALGGQSKLPNGMLAKNYAIPGFEEYKTALLKPEGNKEKGTKKGWRVVEATTGLEISHPYLSRLEDTAQSALSLAKRKMDVVGKEGIDTAIKRALEKNQAQTVPAKEPQVESVAPKPADENIKTLDEAANLESIPLDKNGNPIKTESVKPSSVQTPEQILESNDNVKAKLPAGATTVRVTTNYKGRDIVNTVSKKELESGNSFKGAGVKKVEAGTVGQGGKFIPMKEKPVFVALGADIAGGEFPRGQGSPTAMKYRLIDQERQQRGLEPLAKPASVSDQAVMDRATAEIDRNPSLPEKLVAELNSKPRSIDAWERMVLLLHKIDLRHEYEKSAQQAAQAFEDSKEYPDRKADMVAANLRTADLSDQLTELEKASRASGSEQGRGLRSLRIMANEDYSLAGLETGLRASKGGEPLTDSERAQLQKIADDYKKSNDELTAHLAAARLRISTLESGNALSEIQKTPRLPKGADIGAQKTRLQEIISSKIKAGKMDEVTNPVQRLARLFVEGGIKDRDELIDAVHAVLSEADPSITRRDTMDAISGYGDFKQLSKDEVSVRLRGMKGEMQQISKLEDMAKGVPPSKTGVERRTPTDAERKLIRAVNEAKVKFQVPITDPLTQLKSALDTRKIQLQRQIEAMQEKMASGDFSKAPRRELVLDRRAMELKADKDRIVKKFNRMKADYEKATAKNSSKFLDFISNLRRFSVLSGVNVIGKLAAYSATKFPTIAGTEAIGGGLSRIPGVSKVFEKAPSEGGFSAKAISNSIAKGLTQGFVDAYKTARTGQSDLRAAFSSRTESGHEWHNFFQTIHEIVKSPLRRAAFELSLAKRMDFAQRHGADITDPMTQLALSKDAYLDSDRALLLENNRLASGIRGLFRQLEAKDKKTGSVPLSGKLAATAGRVELPILSVPLNYVKQTLTAAFGLISGSIKLRTAFKNGIENLKPEEADAIARHLKYGTIGGAMALWGFIDGYNNGANGTFGGFYQPGEKRKEDQAGVIGAKIAGHKIPGLFLHNPVIAVAQMTHTMGAILASKVNKKSDQTHSLPVATAAGLMGLLNSSPLGPTTELATQLSDPRSAEWAMGEHVKGLLDPQLAQEVARWMDRDAQGNPIKRKPTTITQHVETGLPLLRENVPER